MPMISMESRDLALTIGRIGRTASIYNIRSECARFGVTPEAATKEIDAIVRVIRGWREHFHECGVAPHDIDYIAPAFLPPCFFYREPVQGA